MNPALTAMANALRVGDHLLERLGAAASAREPVGVGPGTTEASDDGSSPWPVEQRSRAVYGAGLVQGVALVTFPAVQLDPHQPAVLRPVEHGLRRVVPAAGHRGDPRRRWPGRALMRTARYQAHLPGRAGRRSRRDVAAGGQPVRHRAGLASRTLMLLLATTSLGIGFGLTVPALNTLRGRLLPGRRGSAVLYLNALLGLGTALAPVLVRGVPWDRLLVGAAARGGAPDRGADRWSACGCRWRWPRQSARDAAAAAPACRPGSGSSPRSRCCTASSRRSTATGRRST